MCTTNVLVRFKDNRIGRHHDVEPLRVDGIDPSRPYDEAMKIMEAIDRLVTRRHLLASSGCGYTMDDDVTRGWIDGGRFGEFTVEEVAA